MGNFIDNLGAGITLILIGVLAHRVGVRWSLRHLRGVCGKSRRVKIVIPSFSVPEFTIAGAKKPAKIPSNVVVMPMAEGMAIGELVKALQAAFGRLEIVITPAEKFSDDGTPFISVGGPSVNMVSKRLLQDASGGFTIAYPEHVAKYGSTTYEPELRDGCTLTEDYGFMLYSRTVEDTRYVVLCGVWAHGTHMATRVLVSPRAGLVVGEPYRSLSNGRSFFSVCYGRVEGVDIAGARPLTMYYL